MNSAPPRLSLYIHFPWCVQKCPYCDFNSHSQPDSLLPEDQYLESLLSDLKQELPNIWGRRIYSIFLGGGTPSLFSGQSIHYLFSQLRAYLNFSPNAEITIEANPNSADAQNFLSYRKSGINRISIGGQSFNAAHLKSLGRAHYSNEINAAIRLAKTAGFNNINLDIMFGLPAQTQAEALKDLKQAIALDLQHISWYQLTIEPNTLFSATPPVLPMTDELFDTQQLGIEILKENGFSRYEVSAFAQEGFECKHNKNYWQFGDYVGLGAGAHSKLSFFQKPKVLRYAKQKHPATYMQTGTTQNRIQNQHSLTNYDLILEFMLNALRLKNGFPLELLEQQTRINIKTINDKLIQAQTSGLLKVTDTKIKPTVKGFDFLDDLVSIFADE